MAESQIETWRREREAQLEAEKRQRVTALRRAKAPPPEERLRRAIAALLEVAENEGESGAARVAAAGRVLDDARAELALSPPLDEVARATPEEITKGAAAYLRKQGYRVEEPENESDNKRMPA